MPISQRITFQAKVGIQLLLLFEHDLSQKLTAPLKGLTPAHPDWGNQMRSKTGLYFTHRNGPILRAETDLSNLQCSMCSFGFHHRNV